ncbi:MAG: bifunctional folylpolyglutamate synthase/dihydrofolate synthase [Sphingobacteriia bacterium]|nr:bifunctional folylpolyglutamate synthase/dihydrofolate synthase [Sphingobacteriia bacterium]
MVRMPHWPKPFWYSKINFGLERILPLLNELGNPHLKLPPVIHVAGTNGKGSTVSFIRTILERANFKVHQYTSPHLLEFNERIKLQGKEITDEYLYEIIERTRLAEEKLGLQVTFFEGTTVAAFIAFSEIEADYLILETGMGGRLDATNVVPSPILSVITPISYDHMEFLGEDLYSIAKEKAGIIKKDSSVVISMQTEEALKALFEKIEEEKSNAFIYGYEYGLNVEKDKVFYLSENKYLELKNLSLEGDHQYVNAATSIAAIECLNLNISDEIISKAIQTTKWPARLQKINYGYLYNLLPQNWEIWVDGAHNASGGQALAAWAEKKQDLPLYVICGMTRNRNVANFLTFLKPFITHLSGIYVEDEPSSYTAEKICEFASSIEINCSPATSFEDALEKILKQNNKPCRILVCGSLFLAAMFLRINKTEII